MIRVSLIRLVVGTVVILGATGVFVVAPPVVTGYAGADPAQAGGDPTSTIVTIEVEHVEPPAPAMVNVASRQSGTAVLAAVGLIIVTGLSLCAGGWMLWRRCALAPSHTDSTSSWSAAKDHSG